MCNVLVEHSRLDEYDKTHVRDNNHPTGILKDVDVYQHL